MGYTVYILQSEKDGRFYIGHTACLEERLRRHNEGRSIYSRSRGPWKVVYREECPTRSQAMKRERELKGRRSRGYIEHLVRASRV